MTDQSTGMVLSAKRGLIRVFKQISAFRDKRYSKSGAGTINASTATLSR